MKRIWKVYESLECSTFYHLNLIFEAFIEENYNFYKNAIVINKAVQPKIIQNYQSSFTFPLNLEKPYLKVLIIRQMWILISFYRMLLVFKQNLVELKSSKWVLTKLPFIGTIINFICSFHTNMIVFINFDLKREIFNYYKDHLMVFSIL